MSCPISSSANNGSTESRSQCPVKHHTNNDLLNPLNNIPPNLSSLPAEDQKIPLSIERTQSSIPKDDVSQKWEYPSPQQFYNALKRKGWETPEEEIDTMVLIHNFLNEQCWQQVLAWEARHQEVCCEPRLSRFQGRPKDISPKARLLHWFRGTPLPFDRHDWVVNRCGKQVRYVIDYYGGEEEVPNSQVPVFYADVRPALDSWQAVKDRLSVAVSEWWRAADVQSETN